MERNVNYATMVSTGEQPDVAMHVTGFARVAVFSFTQV